MQSGILGAGYAGMARNEALMEELKAHFKENGEQVRLLTGRIDWQQKALQEAAPSSSSEPLDSTGQAMSQILKAGNLPRFIPLFSQCLGALACCLACLQMLLCLYVCVCVT